MLFILVQRHLGETVTTLVVLSIAGAQIPIS
jgi:hypothetical protein